MFRLLEEADAPAEQVEIFIDGESIEVPSYVSVAAALLLLGVSPYRQSAVDASLRAPYCLVGSCAECLITINGQSNQLACQVGVTAGMQITRQLSAHIE